ncbi:MAG: MBL fold metallo-hydrolase [Oligoflexia bacterium]|nr:MBL fold metallo-hydrolase [Oligoflexia bacterium]
MMSEQPENTLFLPGKTALRVKLWGTRGSLPSPRAPELIRQETRELLAGFFDAGYAGKADVETYLEGLPCHRFGGYGGNTACIEMRSQRAQVIIDAGSGIRPLGYEMMNGACGRGEGEVHLFFTHFHWDHIVGLPFFVPIFIPGNRIHVYSVQSELEEVFRTVFQKPYFPVPLEQLGATIEYHKLEPRLPQVIGDMTLTPYALDHPDPCWGYRIESGGKVVAHCVDTECTRVSREQLGVDLPLYQNVDLMIFDAQYTLMETIEKVNWGHAAASLGIDIAMREQIRRVVFMHHDPASADAKIAEAEAQARLYHKSQIKVVNRTGLQVPQVDWSFAHEGMTIDL